MAFDFYINRDTNDFEYEKGTLRLTKSKPELLRQRLSVVFKTYTTEWFNNITFGAIDKDFLFQHGVTKQEIDAHFRAIILNYDEVNNIDSWESTVNPLTREYDLKYIVNTDYGVVADYITTTRPDVAIDYTKVESPETFVACEFDDLVNLSNQLHEIINVDYDAIDPSV